PDGDRSHVADHMRLVQFGDRDALRAPHPGHVVGKMPPVVEGTQEGQRVVERPSCDAEPERGVRASSDSIQYAVKPASAIRAPPAAEPIIRLTGLMPPSGLPVGLTQASLPARPTGRNYRPRGGSARRTGGPPRPGSIGR